MHTLTVSDKELWHLLVGLNSRVTYLLGCLKTATHPVMITEIKREIKELETMVCTIKPHIKQ